MNVSRLIALAAAAAALATPVFAQTAAQPAGAAAAGQPAVPAAPAQQMIITPAPGQNIIAELKASGQFTILLKALDATNLTSVVAGNPHLTLFAPTDAAFNALPPGQLDQLMLPANLSQLQRGLAYHLINTALTPASIQGHGATPVPTIAGTNVTIDGSTTPFRVNDAAVIQAGVPAANGSVIYVIDKVLSPNWRPAPAAPAAPTAPSSPPHGRG